MCAILIQQMSPQKGSTGQKKTILGIIQVTRKGVAYMPMSADGPKGKQDTDIEIAPGNLHGALNGDRVSVELMSLFPRPKGKVVKVEARAKTEFVCTIKLQKNVLVAVADDARFYRPIHIKNADVKEGDKVLVKLGEFDGTKDPEGEIIETIGTAGEHRTEMNAIVLEHGFRTEFSEAVAREAKEIEENHAATIEAESKHRSDFRDITTFTIDPASAKDFDDALSLQEFPDGTYEIGVHIADVTFFVRPGMALEEEAQKRGTSVYLVDATIPMLPHELSGNVCSLKEGEDRLAFSAIFKMNKNGEVLERRFERTIINSNKRFTYEEAQEILDQVGGGAEGKASDLDKLGNRLSPRPYERELIILRSLSRILRKKREQEGAIDFGDNEVKFELDENGNVLRIVRKERIETNLLIEEFMLLANREVAKYVSKLAERVPEKNYIFLYRIHDEPKADRIEELSTFVRAVGYDFGRQSGSGAKAFKYSAKDIAKLA